MESPVDEGEGEKAEGEEVDEADKAAEGEGEGGHGVEGVGDPPCCRCGHKVAPVGGRAEDDIEPEEERMAGSEGGCFCKGSLKETLNGRGL